MEDIKLKDISIDEFKKDVYSYYLEIFPEDEDSHEKSVIMMKEDGIID